MKSPSLPSILVAAAFSLAVAARGQAPYTPAPALPSPAVAEKEPYHELTLKPGSLVEVLEQLGSIYGEAQQKTGLGEYVVPNLVYGPGAKDARVEAPLRLLDARAADALALIAAAAGCVMEPIHALPQEEDGPQKLQRIVGYRIVPAARPTTQLPGDPSLSFGTSGGPVGTVGMMLGEQNGDIMIREVLPGLPAAQSKAILPGEKLLSIAEEGSGEVPAATLGWERATQMLTGKPGSTVTLTVAAPQGEARPRAVLLTRKPSLHAAGSPPPPFVQVVEPLPGPMAPYTAGIARRPTVDPASAVATPAGTMTEGGFGGSGTPGPVDGSAASFVRIYPVAFIISGDENQVAEKQKDLEQLVMESLEHAKLHTGEGPMLSVHRGTKVLIVKANAAQHEIIQQIITALKENDSAAAQNSNLLRR